MRPCCATSLAFALSAGLLATTACIRTQLDPAEVCLLNLRQIQSAKGLDEGWSSEPVAAAVILPHLKDRKLPVCPAGGTYIINPTDDNPACTKHGDLLDDCDVRGRLSLLKVHTRQVLKDARLKWDRLEVDERGRLELGLSHNSMTNLGILSGMPIAWLDLEGCSNVTDLLPLKGAPLTWLTIEGTSVSDLSPLKGAPLRYLNGPDGVTDLSPLKGMPLDILYLDNANVRDLSPLRGAPITHLLLGNAIVHDLTPLIGMPLRHLHLPLQSITNDVGLIRKINTIEQFRARREDMCTRPEVFWELYDRHFPGNAVVGPQGAASRGQPVGSETNRASAAAGPGG